MDKVAFRKYTKEMKQQLEALKKKTHKAEPVSCEDIEACQQTLNSIIESGGGPIGDE